ncbi:MAG: hypothetical protein DPW18_08185 [Chloroflexi bacterium]|nr:hypothetical protein [Chloroflexota bacterium]MDL1942889.1 hypothetical protein [Chloroflexi bacterium CFX2]
MNGDGKDIEKLVLIRLMRLNAAISGLALGLLLGLTLCLATNLLVIKGGEVVGPHLALLGQFFFGYTVTFAGSVVGFLYAFFLGFAAGYFFAYIYNKLADFRERRRLAQGREQ